jgi:hypothetical protein
MRDTYENANESQDLSYWQLRAEHAEFESERRYTLLEQVHLEAVQQAGLIGDLRRELADTKAALERVRALHVRDDSNPRGPWCNTCLTIWPCATHQALDDPTDT